MNEEYTKLIIEVTEGKEEDVLPLRPSDIALIDEAVDSLNKIKSRRPLGDIIRCRFGLGKEKLSCGKIGEIYGVTRDRICQNEAYAIRRLQHPARNRIFFHLLRSYLEERIEFLEKETEKPILEKSIYDFELSVRAYNCLKNAGIGNIRDLAKKTKQEILRKKNFGKKTLKELEEILGSLGLGFNMRFDI